MSLLSRWTPPPQGCPQGLLPSPLLSLNAHPTPRHPTEDATRTKIPRVSLTSLRASVTGRPGAEGSRKQSECGQCSASRGTDHGDRLGQGRWDSAPERKQTPRRGATPRRKSHRLRGLLEPLVGKHQSSYGGENGVLEGARAAKASVLGARTEARPEPPQALFIYWVILSRLMVHPFHQHRQTLRCRQPGRVLLKPWEHLWGP